MNEWIAENQSVRHNCLLTRYPLFFLGKNWGEIPKYIRQHGYDVMESPSLPQNLKKVHLFTHETLCPLVLKNLEDHQEISSYNLILNPMKPELWINYVILLAEKDFLKED